MPTSVSVGVSPSLQGVDGDSPATLAELEAAVSALSPTVWLTPSTIVASAGEVDEWNGYDGTTFTFLDFGPANKPNHVVAEPLLNGYGCVEDTNGKLMESTGGIGALTDFSFYWVGVHETLQAAKTEWLITLITGTDYITVYDDVGGGGDRGYRDGTAIRNVTGAAAGAQYNAIIADATGLTAEHFKDGVSLGSTTYDGTWGHATTHLYMFGNSGTNPGSRHAELLMFPAKHDATQRAAVEAYLTTKYAL